MTIALVDNTVPEVFTLADLVDRMVARSGAKPSDRNHDQFVRAIQDAIRQLPSKLHDWRYYRRTLRFTSSPAQALTVDYQYTGGSHERLMTATTGEFPEDAAFGEVFVNNLPYRIYKRISSTEVQIHEQTAPTSDFTGAEARWVRSEYRLPRRMTKVHALVNRSGNTPLMYMDQNAFYEAEYIRILYGYPSRYTITNIGLAGHIGVKLSPAPEQQDVFECNLTVSPLVPQVRLVSASDVVTSEGSDEITSDSSQFTDKLLNCLVRVSYDSAVPVGSTALHKWQAFVVGIPDSNKLKLSEPCPFSSTDQTVAISSPIDIDADTMLAYVEAEAYQHYCRNHNHASIEGAMAIAQYELRAAIASDSRINRTRGLDITGGTTRWGLDDYMYVIE
jgi:hypothetical protein